MSDTPRTDAIRTFQCSPHMPGGWVPAHKYEEMESELTTAIEQRDKLQYEREFFQSALNEQGDILSKAIEQRDKLAEELKEAQDAISLMLKDSSCRTIPRYTKEQLNIVTGEQHE
jgi:hypothetical protein